MISNEGSYAHVCQLSKNMIFLVPFPPFLAHFLAQIAQNGTIIFFFVILKPCDFQRGVTCLCFTIGPRGGFFTLLGPFLAQRAQNGPMAYDPSKFLKMVKTSHFEDFEDLPRAKKVLFQENSKNIWRYTPKEARNPELSRYNRPSCWNPRPKPPINELF